MKKMIMTLLVVLLMGCIFALLPPLPAQAAICRQTLAHQVCILSIERSAKNYWEYRATVTVDGETRPIEVYNCRDRVRVKPDGSIVPFEISGAGEVICRLLRR